MVKQKLKKFQQKIQPKQSKPILRDPNCKSYLEALHKHFFCCKHRQNCKWFCFHLQNILISDSKSKTCLNTTYSIDEIILANMNYCETFDLNITELNKMLPIVYWLFNIHMTSIGTRFIVASKLCWTKLLSDMIFEDFKMIFSTAENSHNKSVFHLGCKKLWVLQTSFPIFTVF